MIAAATPAGIIHAAGPSPSIQSIAAEVHSVPFPLNHPAATMLSRIPTAPSASSTSARKAPVYAARAAARGVRAEAGSSGVAATGGALAGGRRGVGGVWFRAMGRGHRRFLRGVSVGARTTAATVTSTASTVSPAYSVSARDVGADVAGQIGQGCGPPCGDVEVRSYPVTGDADVDAGQVSSDEFAETFCVVFDSGGVEGGARGDAFDDFVPDDESAAVFRSCVRAAVRVVRCGGGFVTHDDVRVRGR